MPPVSTFAFPNRGAFEKTAIRSRVLFTVQGVWVARGTATFSPFPATPGSSEKVSFARECRGSCRGPGGTPHSKFVLLDNVGSGHRRHVSMQTR